MNKVTGDTIRWYGNGYGSFRSGVRIATQDSALWRHRFELTGVGDLNGDGIADAVAHDPGNRCTLRFLGTRNGTYGNPSRMSSACFATQLSGMGDINGDGRGEMVGYDDAATPTRLRIFTGSSAGYFGLGTTAGTGRQYNNVAR